MNRSVAIGSLLLVAAGCGADGQAESALAELPARASYLTSAPTGQPVCEAVGGPRNLPEEVRESSGLAQGRRSPGVFWTHNDAGNDASVYAIDATGNLLGRVQVTGAEAVDWEDIESGPCASGDCLFIGDIGDNDAARDVVTIYEVAEPDAAAGTVAVVTARHASFPGGGQDAESLFVLPDGSIYVVTKGREGPIGLYRFPGSTAGASAMLEHVRELFPAPAGNDDRVTAATASPDGRWVGIRSYRTLYLYPTAALIGGEPLEPTTIDLRPLGHPQGESVAISADGTVWLSSEAENRDQQPLLSQLRCSGL